MSTKDDNKNFAIGSLINVYKTRMISKIGNLPFVVVCLDKNDQESILVIYLGGDSVICPKTNEIMVLHEN